MKRRVPRACLLVLVHCMGARSAVAQSEPAIETPSQPPALLAHVFHPEDWSANFQATYIWQRHNSFEAQYDGPHSLSPKAEIGYTLTSTLYLGHRLWRGAALFFNPEVIQSQDLSGLHGLGGLSNGENQKTGGPTAKLYSARLFLR
jgi:hypothetical protein